VNFRVSSGSISLPREDGFFRNRQVATLNEVGHLT
jgi:hypothetical protein